MCKKYRIAIIAEMPKNSYSGGRYHSWILAEALAAAGDYVSFYTNNIPLFADDFSAYPDHKKIDIVLLNDFLLLKQKIAYLDYVICVPSSDKRGYYFYSCLLFALNSGARFILINFETPNWFELYGRDNPDPDMYRKMLEVAECGCLVLSSAQVSQNYSRQYYVSKKVIHDIWSPAINSLVADQVKSEKKENQIFIAMRLSDSHKGTEILIKLMNEQLQGTTIVCMFGKNYTDEIFLAELESKANLYGIKVKFLYRISDAEKFKEIKRSKVVLFPSTFEGYGYPPVEALYCGTYVLAYDLPVIHEICGDSVDYCKQGDVEEMKKKIGEILRRESRGQIVADTANFMVQSGRIHRLLEKYEVSDILYHSAEERGRLISEISNRLEHNVRRGREDIPIVMYALRKKQPVSLLLDEENESLQRIDLKGKKIYLYGCGEAYHQLYEKYKYRLSIDGLIDRDQDMIGQRDDVSGKYIIQSPDVLYEEDPKKTVIFITPINCVDVIIRQIKAKGDFEVHSLCMIEINEVKKRNV